jgi:PAS domain S-box-containing protein
LYFQSDTAKALQENDRRIMAARKPENVEESTILNGRPVTYITNKAPFFDDDGNVSGICGVGFEITHQKELERELKEAQSELENKVQERTAELSRTVAELSQAELRYRTVADYTYDWEYWTNLDGSLNYVSPSCQRVSGYSSRQFIDNPSLLKATILSEDQNIWEDHYHDARAEHKAREIQFRIRHKDGSIRWIEHVCHPIVDDEGVLLGFRASNRDVTNRKNNELQLEEAYLEIKSLKEQLEADQIYLREEIKTEHDYENIIGDSEVMQYVFFRVQQVAPTNTTVLIQGETGTGKELIARAIHNASQRRDRPLIKVDCASLPSQLIESELFGHEKGAFTHAFEKRIGRFELADGATLFLDEIGELPLELQAKLLRVLQDGEFERLGSSKTINTNVRVIAATNRDLEADARNKKFRMDLLYRLNVFTISLPPLRERKEDIGPLVEHMIHKLSRKLAKRIQSIPSDALRQLREHPWPGNVRELENVIERAVIHTQGSRLQLDIVEQKIPSDLQISNSDSIVSLKEVERDHILKALWQTNWKLHGKDGAATLLDINPSTLRGRMRKHGIQRPPFKA